MGYKKDLSSGRTCQYDCVPQPRQGVHRHDERTRIVFGCQTTRDRSWHFHRRWQENRGTTDTRQNIPEAFFCFNDPIAIGAIEVFKEHGYRIPGIWHSWFHGNHVWQRIWIRRSRGVEQPADEMGSFGTHPAGHDQWQEIQFRYHRQT